MARGRIKMAMVWVGFGFRPKWTQPEWHFLLGSGWVSLTETYAGLSWLYNTGLPSLTWAVNFCLKPAHLITWAGLGPGQCMDLLTSNNHLKALVTQARLGQSLGFLLGNQSLTKILDGPQLYIQVQPKVGWDRIGPMLVLHISAPTSFVP